MLRLVLPFALLPLPVLAQEERIPSHCQAIAAAEAQVVPVTFGAPLEPDSVRIRFIDHAMYMIETHGGLTAVTDYSGFIGSTDVVPDIVTMNNAHRTHWTPSPDPRITHVLPGWAEEGAPPVEHRLDLGEMLVRNVTTDVRPRYGDYVRPEANSIFIFEVAGLCIGHLGHLHQIPTDEDFASIGRLDVVMVPVDGGYTMATADMAQVVQRLRSSVVLPMHWFSGASLQQFLRDMEGQFQVVELDQPDLTLSLDLLPSDPTIIVLQPAFLD